MTRTARRLSPFAPLALLLLTGSGLALTAWAAPARADVTAVTTPVAFNIPAQPLAAALNALALQANLQMLFEDSLVRNIDAPAVVGSMTARDALHELLARTSLRAIENADGTIVIRPAPVVAKRTPAAAPAAVAAAAPVPAVPAVPTLTTFEQEGPWVVRLRALYLDPQNHSTAFAVPAPGPAAVPADAVRVNQQWHPEFDAEYFFSSHWSTELALAGPRTHTLAVRGSVLAGAGGVGSFKWMTDVLTLKYNLLSDGPFRPYVGIGINLVTVWDVQARPFGLDSTTVGPAAQAGFDIKLADHWFLNADAKWLRVRPELRFESNEVARPKFDPMLYGIGVGYRFGGRTAPVPAVLSPPPVLDSDGDGVPDDRDSCPNTPAGVAVDAKGCPLDADHDGVPDYLDQCPSTPAGAAVDAKGCPLDSDHDGVADYLDRCPGTPAGLKVDANGCEIEELVLRGVNFATGSATLLPDAAATLDGVVDVLKQRATARAEIHGYTDSVGKDSYNQKLSERRARAVVDYLIAHGIAAGGLSAIGFGKADPIASNATAEGRAQNRRVTVRFMTPVAT